MRRSDSAGVPWEGRSLSDNLFAEDDGSELSEITSALRAFHNSEIEFTEVLNSFKDSRVLIPLVPKAAGTKLGQHGQKVDTSSDMHIVAIEGPDKLPALPIFTSSDKLSAWNSSARPVPVQFERALLAAAAEGQTRVIVNPGENEWFAIRRPAIESLAKQEHWVSPEQNPEVKSLVSEAISDLPIEGFKLISADPDRQLVAEELGILLKLPPDLPPEKAKEVVPAFLSGLKYERFNFLVDSLKISLVS